MSTIVLLALLASQPAGSPAPGTPPQAPPTAIVPPPSAPSSTSAPPSPLAPAAPAPVTPAPSGPPSSGLPHESPSLDTSVPVGEDADKGFGPFYAPEAPSDAQYVTVPRGNVPILAVGKGAFCFLEDSGCSVSLLASADVAIGLYAPAGNKGPDLPYAHYNFRGGFVVRPLLLARGRWHPWGIGAIAGFSRGTGLVETAGTADDQRVDESPRTHAIRVGVVNQIWLSQRAHAFHVDFTLGAVQSTVRASRVELWGTHAEVAFGWGGWGSVFASGDFLDRDNRVVFGFRGHAIIAAPLAALVIAGLAAGGGL